VYRRVDAAAAARGAVCLGGGACCKFDLAGHRLYLSTGELALLTLEAPPRPARSRRRRCPYQVGPRCVARDRRPLGCRIFFCSPGLGEWCRCAYERFHRRIRELHAQQDLPYLYVELTDAITQCACRQSTRGPAAGARKTFRPFLR